MAVRTLGIIGGIAPESTLEYYRTIVAEFRRRNPDGYPPLIINSIDLTKMLGFVTAGALDDLTEFLLDELGRLARAGADLALLASNTPHIVFDRLEADSPLPLLSIVETACCAVRDAGMRRVALFGTRFTMEGGFYPRVFAKAGIEVVLPDAADRETIHTKYMTELVNAQFLPQTRAALCEIADRMRDGTGIEGVILGGTELPLLLRDEFHDGIRFFDTTKLHATAAAKEMLS